MPIRVEAYTMGGIVTGVITRPGHLREILEASSQLDVTEASSAPLDGSPADTSEQRIPVDDLVAAVADEGHPAPVHAAWHPIRLESGPWVVEGDLPTLPGFDPDRALTRPTGTFVFLRDARISLLDHPELGENAHESVLVNRYSVDRVDADLMLAFFFPGAHLEGPPPAPAAPAARSGADPASETA
jgi:hypothetical protein